MQKKIIVLLIALTTPALTGCIAGDASEAGGLPTLEAGGFQVSQFVQDLEASASTSLVTAKVDSLEIEFNQTRPTLVEWRSFTRDETGCELVSTMVYQGLDRSGGFLVHHNDEPCPLSLAGKPSVAEVVALVDRITLPMMRDDVLGGAPVFSVSLAGYCGYSQTEDGEADSVYVWNGAGVSQHEGQVRCGGGPGSALSLVVTMPRSTADETTPQRYIILEQVPAR